MSSVADKITGILQEAVADGSELGCQCAVWRDGSQIVDFSGGWCDSARTRPVNGGSLFPVFSAGKMLAGTAMLRGIALGRLELHAPVSRLWTEFTGCGREEITPAHILSHTTGLFCLPHADSPEELTDWNLMCNRIAAMKPAWRPGSRTKYQALSYSWQTGRPLELAFGKSFSPLLQELVTGPAGISSDFFSGIPAGEEHRLVRLERAADLQPPLPVKQTFWNPTENMLRSAAVRRAALPAFNSLASARGMMGLGAALLNGLLPSEILAEATLLQRPAGEAIPARPGYWEIFGYGFQLFGGPEKRGALYGHGGYGGAEIVIHPESRTVFAFTRNRLAEDKTIHQRIKEALGF
ncbi:MAG: beta-lactamase family protein [Victivallales bacterium]|nr:beta-lactamase family protein [Victivallales bacterium]